MLLSKVAKTVSMCAGALQQLDALEDFFTSYIAEPLIAEATPAPYEVPTIDPGRLHVALLALTLLSPHSQVAHAKCSAQCSSLHGMQFICKLHCRLVPADMAGLASGHHPLAGELPCNSCNVHSLSAYAQQHAAVLCEDHDLLPVPGVRIRVMSYNWSCKHAIAIIGRSCVDRANHACAGEFQLLCCSRPWAWALLPSAGAEIPGVSSLGTTSPCW